MENKSSKLLIISGISCLVVLLAIFSINSIQSAKARRQQLSVDTSEGRALIREQEEFGIDFVRDMKRQQRAEKMRAACEERIEELESDTSKVWSMFEDYLFFGDSRCVEFVYGGMLPSSRCIADYAVNIRDHLQPNLYHIEEQKPSYIYLEYGVNDISCGNWITSESYAAEYGDILDQIHALSPDSKIYLNSILLAFGSAYDRYSGFSYIPDWNQALRELCTARDYCYYVDNDSICNTYEYLYLSDGVHMEDEFYSIWASNILTSQYRYELEEALESDVQEEVIQETSATVQRGGIL